MDGWINGWMIDGWVDRRMISISGKEINAG